MCPRLIARNFQRQDGLRRGANVLADAPTGKPDIILIATGSEVSLIVAACEKLTENRINVRIVSMSSWELFEAQPQSCRDSELSPSSRARLAVEAGVTQGWHRYVGEQGAVIGMDRFGASASGKVMMREYGFTVDHVYERAMKVLNRKRPGSSSDDRGGNRESGT